jgi:hypothetical protein
MNKLIGSFIFSILTLLPYSTFALPSAVEITIPSQKVGTKLTRSSIKSKLSDETRKALSDAFSVKEKSERKTQISILESMVTTASEEDKGYLVSRIGYLKDQNKDIDGAYIEWEKLATGEISANALLVTDAASRMAFLQRREKKPFEAMSLFKQIAEKSPLKDDAAYARLQVAGFQWELGKGDYTLSHPAEGRKKFFYQSIDTCNLIIADKDINWSIRCIAELIKLEDYYFLGDYEKALQLGEGFQEKYSEMLGNSSNIQGETWIIYNTPKRHVLTGLTWLCFCYYRTGNYIGCIETSKLINNGTWDSTDPYRNFNVFGYARLYEGFSFEKLNNEESANEAFSQCKLEYPKWYDAMEPQVRKKLDLQ